MNLLSNAAKFTERGVITLLAAREPGRTIGADLLVVQVADTGIGMTEQQMEQLFKRFHQADASTTRRFGGTGRGLALSRAFSGMIGGEITVTSVLGEGSRFTLRAPASLGVNVDAAPEVDGITTGSVVA